MSEGHSETKVKYPEWHCRLVITESTKLMRINKPPLFTSWSALNMPECHIEN